MKIKIHGQAVDNPEEFFSVDQAPELLQSFNLSHPGGEATTEITATVEDDQLLKLEFDDDTVWVTQIEDLKDLLPGTPRPEDRVLEIPTSLDLPADERGTAEKVSLRKLSIFNPRLISAEAVRELAGDLEAEVLSEGLHVLDAHFILQPYKTENDESTLDRSRPVLLFLHGTGSNTAASFGGLRDSEAWSELRREYGGNILTFEHRTWTQNPLENARDLLEKLPRKARLHLISHSSGGIVGDLLSRCNGKHSSFTDREITYLRDMQREGDAEVLEAINALAREKNISVEKQIRVACPAAGTSLLSRRLDHFLNFLLNAVGHGTGQQTGPVFPAVKSLLTAITDQRNRPDVLPGLEAMIPDSPLQGILNNPHVEVNDELYLIAGKGGRKILRYLSDRLDYPTDHDFVVDTEAMFMGLPRAQKVYYYLVSGEEVDHFSYFRNTAVQQHVVGALTGKAAALQSFKELDQNRAPAPKDIAELQMTRGFDLPSLSPSRKPKFPPLPPVAVRMVNGHLNYATYPVLIGHFLNDGIVSAEKEMDYHLDRQLSGRYELGLYPGAVGTNLVVFSEGKTRNPGAVIVGLGVPEEITPFRLSQTVEQGCLEYAMINRDESGRDEEKETGISTLLIGSSYGNLSLSNSIQAILEGVRNANKKIQSMEEADLPLITELEFIELYQEKAVNAFYLLHDLVKTGGMTEIELQGPIRKKEGARTLLPVFTEKEWWKRITALMRKDEQQSHYLSFSASSGRAKVEDRALYTNHRILESLLRENSTKSTWDRELTKTIFDLLIPNDFKLSFRNQQNMLLILDKSTAEYPWELLHYDRAGGDPICVSAGMIRQLSTSDDRRVIHPVVSDKALIIGDPLLDSAGIGRLPGAREEAREVEKVLQRYNYDTVARIGCSFTEVIKKLYDDYKIIHIASHGVIDYGPEKRTGILLSDDVVLTVAEINQLDTTPELVFVNSCYMGQVEASRERHFQDKFKLAANIGTQLIEIGVKAVVVAGWAVHDRAAKRFAQVFYQKMLAGETFGEAVKAARKICYREFPRTNTWGAYQCYGDPFYQLEQKELRRNEDQAYLLEKEALIDLEILINEAKYAEPNRDRIKEKLEKISRRIDESGLRNARITEMEATAYAEIMEFEIAIERYERLLSEEKALHSLRALEQWCNLKGRHLAGLKDKEGVDLDFLIEAINKVIHRLRQLLDFGKTSERYSLLGSAYKRKAMLIRQKEKKQEAVREMAEAYKQAFLHHNEDLRQRRPYPLTNWIIGEKLLNDKDRLEGAKEILEAPLKDFITAKKEESESSLDPNEFWDLIERINFTQCLLFFYQEKDDLENLTREIIKDYREAWDLAGSERHKDSEIAQMTFIRDTLAGFGMEDKPVYERIVKLLEEF